MQFHEFMKEDKQDKSQFPFSGSQGWLHRFSRCYDTGNKRVSEEANSADNTAAAYCPAELVEGIHEGDYIYPAKSLTVIRLLSTGSVCLITNTLLKKTQNRLYCYQETGDYCKDFTAKWHS